ncbi:MAG: PEGA domain-containing protein [Methanosarcinales archaeon]
MDNVRCECAGEAVYTGSSGEAYLILDTGATYYARGYAPSGYECTDCYEAFAHTSDRNVNFSMKKKPVDGMLAIGSSPHGAKVYVDNVYRGTTPATQYNYLTLPAGTYNVKLTLEGYKDATTTARVDPGRTTYHTPVLEAETGNVYVTAKLSDGTPLIGAEIYVDDVATGVFTPGTVTTSVGNHTIVAKKEV